MRYELSRGLQEKVIDLLGSVTRVSVETKRIVDAMNEGRCGLLAQNPRLKLGRCLAAYACPGFEFLAAGSFLISIGDTGVQHLSKTA
jgi:hypothetical protein